MPPPGFQRFAWHLPCVTGALPAVALVLSPRVGGFAYILRVCGLFIWSILKIQQFLPLPQPPLVFIARSYGDLSSWSWNPSLCHLAWGWDYLLSRYPSQFLSTTWEHGSAHAATTATSLCHTESPCLHPSYQFG